MNVTTGGGTSWVQIEGIDESAGGLERAKLADETRGRIGGGVAGRSGRGILRQRPGQKSFVRLIGRASALEDRGHGPDA